MYLPGTGHSPKGWYGQEAHRGQTGLELAAAQAATSRLHSHPSSSPVSPRAPTRSSHQSLLDIGTSLFTSGPLAPCDCDAAGGEGVQLEGLLAGERGLGSGQPWAEPGRVDV